MATGQSGQISPIISSKVKLDQELGAIEGIDEGDHLGPVVNLAGVLTVRVLVVDDCRLLANDVAEGLSDQGIAVDIAYDGTEAAIKLGVNSYEVVVLDRTLPGIQGDTLCQLISAANKRTTVLMISGAASPNDRVDGLRLGADDYLVKPFHFPELVIRVRALARRSPRATPRVLRAGGLELDCLSRTVTRDGRPIKLLPKELAVLEALMASAPSYLSAEQLLETVWDQNADPFTKTVAVTIGRLRRKLGGPPAIETATGIGYRVMDQCPGPMLARPEPAALAELRPAVSTDDFGGVLGHGPADVGRVEEPFVVDGEPA